MPIIIAVLVIVVWGFLLWGSLSALRRRRLLQDLPTSKTAGIFIGLVELKGTAESENPLLGPLSEKPCVWHTWDVQEHWSRTVTESYRDSDGKTKTRTKTESGWKTVASGKDAAPFYLKDELGVVRIDPQGAEIHSETVFNRTCGESDPLYYGKGPANGVADSTGSRSFTERAIPLHHSIYVVGQSRERSDCVAPEITRDRAARLFLISTSPEESHHASGHWKFWLLGALFVLLPFGLGIAAAQEARDPVTMIAAPLGSIFVSGIIFGTGLTWLVYNSLIELKNRVKMAAANIDVELRRRHDLIPPLIRTVEGMGQHERDIQETVALLRNQAQVTDTSSSPKGCAAHLLGLVEHYPELQSNGTFMKLHENLVQTEQRIALARGYFNDVIETYNNRRQRWPESLVAALARLQPIPHFKAEGFQRAAVEVHLVQ